MAENSCLTYYFDLWPSILSTVCLVQVSLSLAVGTITTWSGLTMLPIIVGGAGCLVNGLSYYLFYTHHPLLPTIVASVIADLSWLVQEAGLSFYSYMILIKILRQRSKIVFLCLFWLFMACVVTCRILILVARVQYWQLGSDSKAAADKQQLLNQFHLGFFIAIAICESISSFYLLRSFFEARKVSREVTHRGNIIAQLIRNSEMRVALLAFVGISRAVTHALLVENPATNGVAAQLDRFVYVLECTFPFLWIFDILASRIANAQSNSHHSQGGIPNFVMVNNVQLSTHNGSMHQSRGRLSTVDSGGHKAVFITSALGPPEDDELGITDLHKREVVIREHRGSAESV